MRDSDESSPSVALLAINAAGLAALEPTRQMLDAFAVSWRDELWAGVPKSLFNDHGLRAVVVASADGVLPGVVAGETGLPVIRVPIPDETRAGIDLLCDPATANLPAGDGTPFATVAIGEAGAKNAALFVVSMLGLTDARLWDEWIAFRQRQTDAVLAHAPLMES